MTTHLITRLEEAAEGSRGRVLSLALKAEYFDAIRDGVKLEEYRLMTPYWRKRLEGRSYDRIILMKGYPSRDDHERRLERPWRGYRTGMLTHPHFGPDPVEVFAINVAPTTRSGFDAGARRCYRFPQRRRWVHFPLARRIGWQSGSEGK